MRRFSNKNWWTQKILLAQIQFFAVFRTQFHDGLLYYGHDKVHMLMDSLLEFILSSLLKLIDYQTFNEFCSFLMSFVWYNTKLNALMFKVNCFNEVILIFLISWKVLIFITLILLFCQTLNTNKTRNYEKLQMLSPTTKAQLKSVQWWVK